jgi:hypothetical protein
MTETKLLETSMADVLKAIEAATDLSPSQKTHWSCSVRQICIGIGRPPESIAGRWSAVNAAIQRLHHVITVGRDVLDLQRNDIAGAELAIDCKIEHRKVARSLLRLKFASDRPDVLGPQRRPRTSKLAFVPRFSLWAT